VLVYGEKCQYLVTQLEQQREARAPVTQKIAELKAQKRDLESRKRQLTKEQEDELVALEKQLSALPECMKLVCTHRCACTHSAIDDLHQPTGPYFGELDNYHQYDELSLNVVRVMTNAILDSKQELEDRIATMVCTYKLTQTCTCSLLVSVSVSVSIYATTTFC
jgi:DNA repair exonuclease SbcCD ATPase subunit